MNPDDPNDNPFVYFDEHPEEDPFKSEEKMSKPAVSCPTCGSKELQSKTYCYEHSNIVEYTKYLCKTCNQTFSI